MRGYKTLIQEAELMAMTPDAVADFLKERSGKTKDEARDYLVDEVAEQALRGRTDPLIDLSLARYGHHMEVVSELFQSAGANSPMRLACLVNRSLGNNTFPSFPLGLTGSEPGLFAEWLVTASDDELSALFENPTLEDSFIRDLLERRRGWESIADDKLCRIVLLLYRNPRMRTPRDDDYMDGWDEYSYNAVFDAAWKLAETAPVNDGWALSLGSLYEHLQTKGSSINEPLKLAERWHIDLTDKGANERQANAHEIGHLGDMERVRKGLARLALSKRGKLLADLLGSDDRGLRAAAYAVGNLNAEQLRAGFEKDGEIAFTEAISNLSLWRNQGTRQALSDIAWDIVNNDENSDLLPANRYNWMEKDVRTKHPTWFADEEAGQSDDDEVDAQSHATKADISTIADQIDRQAQGLEAAGQAIRALMSRIGWVWWFSLGALVASLRHV